MALKDPQDALFALEHYQNDLNQLLQALKVGGTTGAAVSLMQSLTTQDIGLLCWSLPKDLRSGAPHLHPRFRAIFSAIQKDVAALRTDFVPAEGGSPALTMLVDQISASVSRAIETQPTTGPSSQPSTKSASLMHRVFSFLAPRPRVRIDRKQYETIARNVSGYLHNLSGANQRVNAYLAATIRRQPTPVEWARAIKMQMCPNSHGVLESAQTLDRMLQLNGRLTDRFGRLVELADQLESVGLSEECIGPARAIVSAWPSVMRMLQKIERDHVDG